MEWGVVAEMSLNQSCKLLTVPADNIFGSQPPIV